MNKNNGQDILRAEGVFPPYNKASGIKDFDSLQEDKSFVPKKQEVPEFDLDTQIFSGQRQLASLKRTGPGKPQATITKEASQPSVEEFLEAITPQSDFKPLEQKIEIKPIKEIRQQPVIEPVQPPIRISSDKISTQVKNLLTRNEEAVIMDIVSRDIANFIKQGAA